VAIRGRLAIIVPAAGRSQRAGSHNKLALPFGETTVLGSVLSKSVALGGRTIVVTGFQADVLQALVEGTGADLAYNPHFDEGMASAIVAGVSYDPLAGAYLIWPGDMPEISLETARILVSNGRHGRIAVPTHENRRGHPVLFSGTFRDDLLRLTGDAGARAILRRHPEAVDEIPVSDPGIFVDIDTLTDHQEALARLYARPSGSEARGNEAGSASG